MIRLDYVRDLHAYAVRRDRELVGFVRFTNGELPFRRPVTFGEAR